MNWRTYAEHVIDQLNRFDHDFMTYYGYYLRENEMGIVALATALEQANRELMWVPMVQQEKGEPHAK